MSERTEVQKGVVQTSLERQQVIEELTGKGYCYISNIGSGSFSDVFRVWDARRNSFLACKVSTNQELAEREAKMLQQLQYPIFPRYMESWKCGNRHYLLMENIAGSNVRELLQRRGCFSQRQAVWINLALAQGLMYLHERSDPIVFRDIKPENVMVRQDGNIKLVDVGCACRKGENASLAGSRGYGAPEQFQRRACVSEESDVYALGKLLFLLLTGDEPCKLEELSHKKNEYKRNQYKEKIAPGLLQLVAQATESERSKRIPDMRTFLQRLAVYAEKPSLIRFWTDAKAYLCGGGVTDFYYIQNVRKGMDGYV